MNRFNAAAGARIGSAARMIALGCGAALVASTAALAQQPRQTPLDGVFACTGVADASARLACFDQAAAALKAAEGAGEFTAVTRSQIEEVERDTFGMKAPSVAALAPPPRAAPAAPAASAPAGESAAAARPEPAPQPERLDRVTLNVAKIFTDRAGKLVITMENGQVWRQVDSERVRRLGKGPWVAQIRRAALGSYLLNLDDRAAIRVRREE
ncbi:hypothetical protein GC169_03315 [bacterium]|nr:hypothetical protein [bacterium]